MIIGSVGGEVKLLNSEGMVPTILDPKKSKSGSSLIIAYPWPIKIKVGHKSGVATIIRLSKLASAVST